MQNVIVKKYLIGVSGGPDSMALLDMYKKQVAMVCHVNYQKRLTSYEDCEIVKNYCKKYHLKFQLLNVSKSIYEKYLKINHNFQSIARAIRYDFFKKCAMKYKLRSALIAHQNDDFLETAIMQLKRKIITLHFGIQQHSNWNGLRIYRPLLFKYWKQDLIKYCIKHHVNYKEDETNVMNIYERNRIRKQLNNLSLKSKEKLLQKITTFNKNHQNEYKKIRLIFGRWFKTKYSITFFKKQVNWIKYFLLFKFLKFHNVGRISHNKIMLIFNFLYANSQNKKLRLGGELFLIKKYDSLIMQK